LLTPAVLLLSGRDAVARHCIRWRVEQRLPNLVLRSWRSVAVGAGDASTARQP